MATNNLSITEIENRTKQLIETLDKATFIEEFLKLYDIPTVSINRALNQDTDDLILPKRLFYREVASDPLEAMEDILYNELPDMKQKPNFVITTDFNRICAQDTEINDSLDIEFSELPAYCEFFISWNGINKTDYARENPADIKAAERFKELYDELRAINEFDDESKQESEFNLFLIRLLFLLFAEDTEIMNKGIFTNAIKNRSEEDARNLTDLFNQIFASLDKPNRNEEPTWLQEFRYVNGKLFTDASTSLQFDKLTRKLIIKAGELLNWNEINPDILGSMIQTVSNKEDRSTSGMHYTSVENIMKVISPLFLDSLNNEFESIQLKIEENEEKAITEETRRSNRKKYSKELNNLLDRMSQIKFLDPACGSGNFLIITYKELRRLEIKILKELREIGARSNQVELFEETKIHLDQFYGIEINDFAHEVARLSLWIAQYQMNLESEQELNRTEPFLPLREAGNIVCKNALQINWSDVVPHNKTDEIYLIGNPPYIGAKLQSKAQKEDLKFIVGENKQYKKMDYIAGWFYQGAEFINTCDGKLAFVTTNSVFQGEQVDFVWSPLVDKIEIEFAYTSFKWGNNAAHNAGVTVAIVGIANKDNIYDEKLLYDENLNCSKTTNINYYLTTNNNIIVKSSRKPLNNNPTLVFGNMPRDGGNLIINNTDQKNKIIDEFPALQKYIYKYIGAQEFINNEYRYVLWLDEENYNDVKKIPYVKKIVQNVKEMRLSSKAESTQDAAKTPFSFVQRGEYDKAIEEFKNSDLEEFRQLLIPRVSSENRRYIPMGFVGEDTIISDSAMAVYNAPIWLLGLLTSYIHMLWIKTVGGKLETRYRYSARVVYNTFPVPELSTRRKNMMEDQVFEILDIREMHIARGETLATLYNEETMPDELRRAHEKLDEIVERAYKDTPFLSDEDRLSTLLTMYQQMVEEND